MGMSEQLIRSLGIEVPPKQGRHRGRGVRHQPGVMNKLERAYAALLEQRKLAGEIIEWWFEAVTLKLGKDCRYTPDFFVLMADMSLECHETKGGFIREDSAVKIRAAAAMFPFRFVLAQRKKAKETWTFKEM